MIYSCEKDLIHRCDHDFGIHLTKFDLWMCLRMGHSKK